MSIFFCLTLCIYQFVFIIISLQLSMNSWSTMYKNSEISNKMFNIRFEMYKKKKHYTCNFAAIWLKYMKYIFKFKTINWCKTTWYVNVMRLFWLFTCNGTICNGIVHVYINTYDIPNAGLPAQLIYVYYMYICI